MWPASCTYIVLIGIALRERPGRTQSAPDVLKKETDKSLNRAEIVVLPKAFPEGDNKAR
jgi:hypothetical protein